MEQFSNKRGFNFSALTTPTHMHILGLDIGGSGIKGAPVDTDTGALLAPRFRIPTPQPATPDAMIATAQQIAAHFAWQGPVGCGFPSVVLNGVVQTAANIDASWVNIPINERLTAALGQSVRVINDADAAGLAEMRWGAGVGHTGVVMLLTFGTGIGSALFNKGQLVPNTELGHLQIRGKDAERRASDAARERKGWSWAEWAVRVDEYLDMLQRLFWPDLFIIGGGASKEADKFVPLLTNPTPIVAAQLRNEAGIVGAALAAHG